MSTHFVAVEIIEIELFEPRYLTKITLLVNILRLVAGIIKVFSSFSFLQFITHYQTNVTKIVSIKFPPFVLTPKTFKMK